MTAELEQIKSDIEKVIKYSQELDAPKFNIDSLINQWLKNKKKFIYRLKKAKETNKNNDYSDYIFEFPDPVSFPLDEMTRNSKVSGFVDYLLDYFYEKDVPESVSHAFLSFLRLNKASFFDNKVSIPCTYNGNEINVGMKLLKAFKFYFSGEMLDNIQTKASMLLQENSVTGRLCISVHPLDFLSASETNYDWRSCHALDGDYRSGNLAYMVDDCTVMCYLRGEDKEKLPRFPSDVKWPSKKWRMLLFEGQEEEIVWAGRQYPFESANILSSIGRTVVPIITDVPYYETEDYWYGKRRNWSDWDNYFLEGIPGQIIADSYMNIGGFLIGKHSLIDSSNDLFYNDLLHSTKYIPSFMTRSNISRRLRLTDKINNRSEIENLHLQVGKTPVCPCCGVNLIEFSDEMVCAGCDAKYGTQANDEFVTCADCGSRVWKEDAYLDDEGNYYCGDCWRSYEEE